MQFFLPKFRVFRRKFNQILKLPVRLHTMTPVRKQTEKDDDSGEKYRQPIWDEEASGFVRVSVYWGLHEDLRQRILAVVGYSA
jgi:hypothetical protein